jgi:DNA repair photolyase
LKTRGRGALSNRAGRFERFRVEPLEDADPRPTQEEAVAASAGPAPTDRQAPTGGPAPDDDPPPLRTTVTPERTRRIISTNDSPDLPFDRSINPYRGCEHGCVYCFARPTHAYLGLSPGLDFETRLFSKPDAARLLREELRRPGYRCATLALGANTTLDRRLARSMEPRTPTPERRLEAIRALSQAGIPAGVLSSPMIPGLNDAELEAILAAAAGAGARSAGYVLLRLPLEIKDLFREWLEAHEPLKAPRVLALLRSMRGGQLYDASFGKRMRGEGPHAELLRQRYHVACRRHGLQTRAEPLDTSRFRVPPRAGDQGSLFEPRTAS